MSTNHYIGMDIHRKFSQVCVMEGTGEVARDRRLWHGLWRGSMLGSAR